MKCNQTVELKNEGMDHVMALKILRFAPMRRAMHGADCRT